MNTVFTALSGSLVLSASFAFHIAEENFEILTPLTKWMFERIGFQFPFIGLTMLVGITFMIAGDKDSQVARFLKRIGEPAITFYASASGSLLGWVIGICIAACIEDFGKYALSCLVVTMMVISILIMPLASFSSARKTINTFNENVSRDQTKESPVRIAGCFILAITIFELVWLFLNR